MNRSLLIHNGREVGWSDMYLCSKLLVVIFAESKSLPLYVLNTGSHQVHIKVMNAIIAIFSDCIG